MAILQLHPIERVRERFDDPPHEGDGTPAHEARKIGLATSHKRQVYVTAVNRGKIGHPGAQTSPSRAVSTTGPPSVIATVCSK